MTKHDNFKSIGKDVGHIEYAVAEAVIGTKGAGLVAKGVKTAAELAIGAERLALIAAKSAEVLEKIKFGLRGVVRIGSKPIKYKTTEMLAKYAGEETGIVWGTKVKYLSEAERAELELFVKDGKIYDHLGNLYDTGSSSSAFGGGGGKSIFVMDENGRIFASRYQSVGKFHHSSILGGEPVSSAGEITVKDGKIVEVSNRSGHYQPTQQMNSQMIDELKRKGVDTSNIKITGF